MFSNKYKKGFTLIEIVLVLILMGILAAVAVSKFYDLKEQAEQDLANAYADNFSAEVNGRIAELLLEGKTCAEAQDMALNSIGQRYYQHPDSNGMIIGPFWNRGATAKQVNHTKIPVIVNYTRPYYAPSHIVACAELEMYTPEP